MALPIYSACSDEKDIYLPPHEGAPCCHSLCMHLLLSSHHQWAWHRVQPARNWGGQTRTAAEPAGQHSPLPPKASGKQWRLVVKVSIFLCLFSTHNDPFRVPFEQAGVCFFTLSFHWRILVSSTKFKSPLTVERLKMTVVYSTFGLASSSFGFCGQRFHSSIRYWCGYGLQLLNEAHRTEAELILRDASNKEGGGGERDILCLLELLVRRMWTWGFWWLACLPRKVWGCV